MPNVTPNPITVIPPKTSGGSLKNAANLIGYSAAAQGPQAELWANVQKALKDAQSQLDGLANALRTPLGLPDPIQVVDAQGNLVANIGTYVNPLTNSNFNGIWSKQFNVGTDANPLTYGALGDNTNDDTNALQTAINTSGGILYLPPGKTFKITTTIVLPATAKTILVYGGGFIQWAGTAANPLLALGPVQVGSTMTAAGANSATTSGTNTTGATLLIVTIGGTAAVTGATVTDSFGNSWHALNNAAGTQDSGIWYAFDKAGAALSVGASHTVTVTFTGGFPGITFSAFAGTLANHVDPFDATAGQSTNTAASASTLQPGSITALNTSLVVTSFAYGGTSNAQSITSPYTLGGSIAALGGTNVGSAVGFCLGSLGATNPTWTATGAATALEATIASFKSNTPTPNVLIYNTVFLSSVSGQTLLSIADDNAQWYEIHGSYFGNSGGGTTIGIALIGNGTNWNISECFFSGTTAVSLIGQTDVRIIGSDLSTLTGTFVTTAGTTSYNLRGCNVLDFYDPPVARVLAYLAAGGQSLTSSTPAALTFDTHAYASGAAIHSTVTNPTRFTAPVAGFYHAFGQFQINSVTNCTLQIILKKNGSFLTPNIQTQVFQNTAAVDTAIQLYGDLQLAAGDFIEFFVNQTTGGAQTTTANCLGALALISQP